MKIKIVTFRESQDFVDRIERVSAQNNTNKSDLMRNAVLFYLEKLEQLENLTQKAS